MQAIDVMRPTYGSRKTRAYILSLDHKNPVTTVTGFFIAGIEPSAVRLSHLPFKIYGHFQMERAIRPAAGHGRGYRHPLYPQQTKPIHLNITHFKRSVFEFLI